MRRVTYRTDGAGGLGLWVNAGWDRSGIRSIVDAVDELRARGFVVHEGSERILRQLAGVQVEIAPTPPRRKVRRVSFEVHDAVQAIDVPWVEQLSSDLGEELGLVGYLPTEGAGFLAASPHGWLYAGRDARRLQLLGHTTEQALLRLLEPPQTWPVVEARPYQPWPLVWASTPALPVPDPDRAAQVVADLPVATFDSGPVLAVADLGGYWRVYRAFRTDWPLPPLVPLLVDKASGAVHIEWPIRREGPSAQDARQALEHQVDQALALRGYQRTPVGWTQKKDDPSARRFRLLSTSDGATRATLRLHLEVAAANHSGEPERIDRVATPYGLAFFTAFAGTDTRPMATLITDTVLELDNR